MAASQMALARSFPADAMRYRSSSGELVPAERYRASHVGAGRIASKETHASSGGGADGPPGDSPAAGDGAGDATGRA